MYMHVALPAVPRSGFCKFIQVILRLVPLGLLLGGPPCGSFTFINRHTSKRSKRRPLGDTGKAYVRENNTSFGYNIQQIFDAARERERELAFALA